MSSIVSWYKSFNFIFFTAKPIRTGPASLLSRPGALGMIGTAAAPGAPPMQIPTQMKTSVGKLFRI